MMKKATALLTIVGALILWWAGSARADQPETFEPGTGQYIMVLTDPRTEVDDPVTGKKKAREPDVQKHGGKVLHKKDATRVIKLPTRAAGALRNEENVATTRPATAFRESHTTRPECDDAVGPAEVSLRLVLDGGPVGAAAGVVVSVKWAVPEDERERCHFPDYNVTYESYAGRTVIVVNRELSGERLVFHGFATDKEPFDQARACRVDHVGRLLSGDFVLIGADTATYSVETPEMMLTEIVVDV